MTFQSNQAAFSGCPFVDAGAWIWVGDMLGSSERCCHGLRHLGQQQLIWRSILRVLGFLTLPAWLIDNVGTQACVLQKRIEVHGMFLAWETSAAFNERLCLCVLRSCAHSCATSTRSSMSSDTHFTRLLCCSALFPGCHFALTIVRLLRC